MTKASTKFLPYGRQLIDDDDIVAVSAVLRSGALTTGPVVRDFETALESKLGVRFASACSSGTAALHLAVLASGLGEGGAAIIPSITFLATANAARFVGAEVVFADVDPDSGLMRKEDLLEALERAGKRGLDVRMVLPVHLNGQCEDMEAISSVARERGIMVVEDACHAIGTINRTGGGEACAVGSCLHSDLSVFSFHPVKTVAMGEGGAVTTNDEKLFSRVASLRNHGIVKESAQFENSEWAFDKEGEVNPWYYEMHEVGFNYLASAIHCALGLSQLKKLDRFVERRRSLAVLYDQLLAPLDPIVRTVKRVPGCEPAWHLYAVLVDFAAAEIDRSQLMRRMHERGIGTQVHYIPLHMQPYYRRHVGVSALDGAESYYSRVLSLPLFPGMAESDVNHVVESLRVELGLARDRF